MNINPIKWYQQKRQEFFGDVQIKSSEPLFFHAKTFDPPTWKLLIGKWQDPRITITLGRHAWFAGWITHINYFKTQKGEWQPFMSANDIKMEERLSSGGCLCQADIDGKGCVNGPLLTEEDELYLAKREHIENLIRWETEVKKCKQLSPYLMDRVSHLVKGVTYEDKDFE